MKEIFDAWYTAVVSKLSVEEHKAMEYFELLERYPSKGFVLRILIKTSKGSYCTIIYDLFEMRSPNIETVNAIHEMIKVRIK